jgi:energy-coupling factor transporter transmembrane protein EcfT
MRPFHPITFWAIFTALAVAVVVSDSVTAAVIALGGAALIVDRFRSDGPWRDSFRWALIAGIYLVIVRAFAGVVIGVPRVGTTLFTLPRIALPHWLPGIRIGGPVTWERLSSSLHEGLIIAVVIALFGAANSVTSPHKLLRILPSRFYQLGVTLTIATSVFPQLITTISRIRQAQYLRSGAKPRITQIALPLLEESLGRAVALAESMESRGFGRSRTVTRYRPEAFSRRDFISIICACISAGILVAM